MTGWTSGVCAANGIALHYDRTGGGHPPVVLLHGLMASGACWTPLARALASDYDVVMPDARGHGESSAPPHGYGYDDHANDVTGLLAELRLSRPVLVGHSMGGMTAAVVASGDDVPLSGLVLVDPTFLSPERQQQVFASDVVEQHQHALGLSLEELVGRARARHPRRSLEIVQLLAEARLKTRPQALDVLRPPNPDYRDVVSTIAVPTLFVMGDTDPVVTPATAVEIQSLNPRVRIAQIRGAGHGLPFDRPEQLADVVQTFLRR